MRAWQKIEYSFYRIVVYPRKERERKERKERERIFSKCKNECEGVRGQRVGFGAFSFLCSPSVGTSYYGASGTCSSSRKLSGS